MAGFTSALVGVGEIRIVLTITFLQEIHRVCDLIGRAKLNEIAVIIDEHLRIRGIGAGGVGNRLNFSLLSGTPHNRYCGKSNHRTQSK